MAVSTLKESNFSNARPRDGMICYFFWWNCAIYEHDRIQRRISKLENDRWVKVPGNHDRLPIGCTLFQYGADLYAIGGWKYEEPIKEVLIFEREKWILSRTIPSMIEGCCRSCVVEVKGCLVVLGGRGSGPMLLDDVQVFSNTTRTWSRGQPLPVACENPSADVYEDIIFVAGGWCMGTRIWSIQYSELIRGGTSQDINIWNILPGAPCMFPLISVLDNSLIIFGGYQQTKLSEKSSIVYIFGGSQQWQKIENFTADNIFKTSSGEAVIIKGEKVTKEKIKDLHLPKLMGIRSVWSSFKKPFESMKLEHFFCFLDFYHPSEFDASLKSFYLMQCPSMLTDLLAKWTSTDSPLKGKLQSWTSLSHKEIIIHVALRCSLVNRFPYDFGYLETLDTQAHGVTSWNEDAEFVHPSMQDFFTAMAIMKLPLYDQMRLLTSPSMPRMVCIFYSGLAYSSFNEQSFSIGKNVVPQMLDGMIRHPGSNLIVCILTAIHCLYQAQEPSLCKSFLAKHAQIFCSATSISTRLSYSDVISMAYFLKHSGSLWEVQVESLNYCHILKDCCTVSISPNGVSLLQCTNTQLLNKKPSKAQSTNLRSILQSLCCETLSDVLYHVIVFLSPAPVLCTSRGPGYVSFVSCPCLKNVVLNNILFQPIPATHWIPGDKKHFKTLQFTGEKHPEVHDKELIEFVIMVSPLPYSIFFTIPNTDETVPIMISMDNKYILDEEDINMAGVECEATESKSSVQMCELVAPPFPLSDLKL